MKKQLLLLVMMLLPMVAMADEVDIVIDGINYRLIANNDNNVAIVISKHNGYTGSVVIPNRVTYEGTEYIVSGIGPRAFANCYQLISVNIPNSVTSIGESAFERSPRITSVTIPNSVTEIGVYAFHYCTGLTSVTFGNSLTTIGSNAFSGCSGLSSVTIPNSVISIGAQVFRNCSGLTSVTIGSGIKYIKSQAFNRCEKLNNVYCYAENVPITETDAFENSPIKSSKLHVPDASVNAYAQSEPWKDFKEIVGLDGTITQKCATPTIKYIGGKLLFECETEDVEFVYSITTPANTTNQTGNNVDMPHTNTVSVYAKKAGFLNSDVATEDIDVRGLKGDVNADGEVNVGDIVTTTNIMAGKDE